MIRPQRKRGIVWVFILLIGSTLSCIGEGGGCTIPDDSDWADVCFWCIEETPTLPLGEIDPSEQGSNELGDLAEDPYANVTVIPSLPGQANITVIPSIPPGFRLDMNAFCRRCANQGCPEAAVLAKGDSYAILGLDEEENWFLVQVDDFKCWVGESTGSVEGSLDHVEIAVTPIVLATQITDCSQFTTDTECFEHGDAGCYWVEAAGVAPYCAGP